MGHHGVKIFDDRKKIDFQQTIIDFQEKTILTSLIATLLEDYSVIFFLLTVCIYLHSHSNSSYRNMRISQLMSKLLHSRTSHLLLVSQIISLQYQHLTSLNSPSAQLTRICYLCHTATAVSDKKVFHTVPLKSGMTYHFRSGSPLHSTALSAT